MTAPKPTPTPVVPDNTLLHRALCSTRYFDQPEVTVFFEALPLTDPAEFLQQLLAPIWGVEPADVQVQLLCSADYVLRHWTRGHPSTGDARLFEFGFHADGTIQYLVPERTMLLVPPLQLQRLAIAQKAAQELQAAGYTCDEEADFQPGDRRRVQDDLTVSFNGHRLDLSTCGVLPGEPVTVLVDDDHGCVQHKVRYVFGGVPVYSVVPVIGEALA